MPKAWPGRALFVLLLAVSPLVLPAVTFTVTNTNDSGPGSLRQAILDSNVTPGMDTIVFAIGSGPQTITPTSALPAITDPVGIDGTTQPGYVDTPLIEISGLSAGPGANGLTITSGNTIVSSLAINRFQPQFLVGGGNGVLLQAGGFNQLWGNFIGTTRDGLATAGNGGDGILISDSSDNSIGNGRANPSVISGNANGVRIIGSSDRNGIAGPVRIGTNVGATGALPNFGSGVVILGGGGNLVSGAVISGNAVDGVLISGGANHTDIWGNWIGTNGAGTAAIPNGSNGIEISGAGTSRNVIGGNPDLLMTNVISGNGVNGILMINGTTLNSVTANRIGTDAAGMLPVGNGANGVIISGASSNAIGHPLDPKFGNVICANATNGVRIRSGATGNFVQANRIGINVADAVVGNGIAGIQINDGATANTVGGNASTGAANWISGNVSDGVLIVDAATAGNLVYGNSIGLDSSGRPAANGGNGVRITTGASGNQIGDGTVTGANRIVSNALAGVLVESGTANSIRANAIYRNGALGIDLAPSGVTANDACDADTGADQLQNFPVISSASSLSGVTTVQGSLDSTASSSFTLDFYANTECDPSGYGQGRIWLGSVPLSTDPNCFASFEVPLTTASPVQFVTATATDGSGNTSEFSACIPVPAAFYSLTPCRLLDTRGPSGPLGGPALAANADRTFPIAGQCGIPATAKALALTVTVTQPTAQGDLRVHPGGGTLPNTSTMNYAAGQTRASNSIVVLGPSTDFVVRCVQAAGTTHFVADVTGYFE